MCRKEVGTDSSSYNRPSCLPEVLKAYCMSPLQRSETHSAAYEHLFGQCVAAACVTRDCSFGFDPLAVNDVFPMLHRRVDDHTEVDIGKTQRP